MPRARLSLNGPWDFIIDPRDRYTVDHLPERAPTIQVPGSWEDQFPAEAGTFGRAWYRRRVVIPAEWRDQAIFLRFGAVNYYTQVWVNGHYVGDHEGGYTPFSFRIDPMVRPGEENVIVVRVVHPAYAIPRFPDLNFREIAATLQDMFGYAVGEIPLGKQNWYGSVSGIWQEVHLEAVYRIFLTHALVLPDIDPRHRPRADRDERAGGHGRAADVALSGPRHGGGPRRRAQWRFAGRGVGSRPRHRSAAGCAGARNPARRLPPVGARLALSLLAARGARRAWRAAGRVAGPLRDAQGPRRAQSDLAQRSAALPARRPRPGFLSRDELHPTLEGVPRRAVRSCPPPRTQPAPLSHQGARSALPRGGDEKGILVWEELPNWLRLSEEAAARGRETLTRLIERDYNHPSLICWTILNESWGANLNGSPQDRAWLKEMYAYVKRLDPDRLVVDNSPCDIPGNRNFHLRTDIEDFHIYYGIPDRYREWERWVREFSTHPSWTFSPYGDAERTGEEPLVVSEFGTWGLPTLKDLFLEYGQEPAWFRTGLNATQPHGVQRRFSRYRLDEIFGSYDQFAIATQWHQYFALKYQIETIRKYPSIVGYVITELTDLHWEANGLLNIWRRPKVFYNALASFQGEDVVLADWSRVNYWEGDQLTIDVVVSQWSRRELDEAVVDWNVSELGVAGTLPSFRLEPGEARKVGTLTFVVAPLDESVRTRLHLRLRDRTGRIVARNVQYLSFFPNRLRRPAVTREAIWVHDPGSAPALAERLANAGYQTVTQPAPGVRLAIASVVDDAVDSFLQQGGRVLLLVRSEEAIPRGRPEAEAIRIRDRRARLGADAGETNPWLGDWVTTWSWVKHEPLCRGIPRVSESPFPGDVMDFQYAEVMPRHVMLGWSHERDFEDVLAGIVVGWVHSPASLGAQCRWKGGGLLATTLCLDQAFTGDPVSTILVHNLIGYLASPAFEPRRDLHARPTRRGTAAGSERAEAAGS